MNYIIRRSNDILVRAQPTQQINAQLASVASPPTRLIRAIDNHQTPTSHTNQTSPSQLNQPSKRINVKDSERRPVFRSPGPCCLPPPKDLKLATNQALHVRCSSTSEIVWARLHGFPWWPALVVKPDGAGFQVRRWKGKGGGGVHEQQCTVMVREVCAGVHVCVSVERVCV